MGMADLSRQIENQFRTPYVRPQAVAFRDIRLDYFDIGCGTLDIAPVAPTSLDKRVNDLDTGAKFDQPQSEVASNKPQPAGYQYLLTT